MLVQVPGVDLETRMAAEKGEPLDETELAILAERAAVAGAWLDGWAPDRYQVSVRDDLPAAEVAELNEVVVRWCRGPLAELTDHALEDPRVTVEVTDVARLIGDAARASGGPWSSSTRACLCWSKNVGTA